jgi:hypothetical protein
MLFMCDRPEPEPILRLWVGCGKARLSGLYESLRRDSSVTLSVQDFHSLFATLIVAPTLFASEEDFYTRIGFFRENAVATADGLFRALMDIESNKERHD